MKNRSRLLLTFALIVCLAFALCAAASADEYSPAVFKTTSFEAAPGGTVSTTLYLEAGSNLIDFEIQLSYDAEHVTLLSAAAVDGLSGDIETTPKDGAVHVSYTRTSENLTKKTDLAILTFSVSENAGPDSYSYLRLDERYATEAHTMVEGELYALPVETDFAPLEIFGFGDVNLSHKVSIADVTYLRQHLAEMRQLTPYQLALSDAYYDHETTIADAVRIQQYLANNAMQLGNRVNVTFYDKDGAVYRVKSVVKGEGLATVPQLPVYTGFYGGVWSAAADETVGVDFQALDKAISVYARYKKDASPAVTFYKERLTDVYYAQSKLTGNLNLVNRLTYQDGYTADVYWSSSNSAVLNASTGVFNKPSYDEQVTLTATIISYQDGSIEAQDYISFVYSVEGQFLCPTKEQIQTYLASLFTGTINTNLTLPVKVTERDIESANPFEVRLSWVQRNADGTEQSVRQLQRGNNEQTVTLAATATFDGVPLEGNGEIAFDNVVIGPVTLSEVRSYIISEIASHTGQTVTNGEELWHDSNNLYNATIKWVSMNHDVADIDNNVVSIKDVVNGTALPINVEVTYEAGGEATTFKLSYTVSVVTNNALLVPGMNIDPALYDALKSATGVYGNLTTDALKNVKFVYLDLSGYPEIEDLTALTYCTNLRVLNISDLHVDETSLNQICTLTKLEALIANHCGIRELTSGGKPVLDQMINLKMLDLAHNELTTLDGVFSRENRYGQLLELYLDHNQLADISALCEVTEQTKKIYNAAGEVESTYTENVVKNRAPMLRFLTLDDNHLNDEDLVAFGNFKVLKYLSLGNNEITSVSPLSGNRSLLELHLQGNRIEDVKDLRYLTHLESLYLSDNNIRNVYAGAREVNVSYLHYLTHLEILYLDHNAIEDVSDLDTLEKLTVLNLNNNLIQDLSVLADKGETLVELYAEHNRIDSFSFIRGLTKLERLMLSDNGSVYEASLGSYLSGLTKLRTLTLSGKDLRSLSFLQSMPELIRLDVANCNLPSYTPNGCSVSGDTLSVQSFEDNVAALLSLKGTLKFLDVSNNGFAYGADAMRAYLAGNGTETEITAVSFVGGTPLHFDALYEMTNLKVLYADNLVEPVNASHLFSVMTGLNYLSMENCGITEAGWLSRLRGLVYLDLAGNRITSIDLTRNLSARSQGTLQYLYIDSAVDTVFGNASDLFDALAPEDHVLKTFSAANVQIGAMDNLPDMKALTYLNLSNSGITNLSGSNPDFAGWFNLSRYSTVTTLDLTGVQADIDETANMPKLKTLYAIGDVEDAIFQRHNLLELYDRYSAGIDCYLYSYTGKYTPNAQMEGGRILGKLDDYSCVLQIAANGVISDNNPTLAASVNGFPITWTISNKQNYKIVDNQIAVKSYKNIDDEILTLTASINVYPGQEPATRSFTVTTRVLRATKADDHQNILINADGAASYLKRGDVFTYDVTCIAAESKGFSVPVEPVYTDIRYNYSTTLSDGDYGLWETIFTVADSHIYTVLENAPLGATTTISVEVGHTIGGVFVADYQLTQTVTIAEESYTVTFVPNEGEVRMTNDGRTVTSVAYPEESVMFEDVTFLRPGYLFNGWFTDVGCNDLFWTEGMEKPVMPSHDLTLYASWTAYQFKVSFNANSGNVSTSEKAVLVGVAYGALPEPEKPGYSFLGWFTEPDGGVQITADSIVALETDQTLYAHWQVNNYSVTLNSATGDQTITVTYGQPYGALPVPTRVGFTFAGWYTAKSSGSRVTENSTVTATANHTLYAQWTLIDYTVYWNTSAHCTISVRRTASPNAGAAIDALTSGATIYYGDVLSISYTTDTGYYLSGNGYGELVVSSNIDSSMIYATAAPHNYTYNVVYKSTNGTSLGSTTVTKSYGTTNTITPPSFGGYNTPSSQSIVWDSTTAKTIMFYYSPCSVDRQCVFNGWWWDGGYGTGIWSTANVTFSNRTANSITATIDWGSTLCGGGTYYGFWQEFYMAIGNANTGWQRIADTSYFYSNRWNGKTTTKSVSITITGLSATQQTVGFYANTQAQNYADCPGEFSGTLTIPTY